MANPHSGFDHVSQVPVVTAIQHDYSGTENGTGLSEIHGLKDRIRSHSDPPKNDAVVEDCEESICSGPHKSAYDHTHRQLKPRHVQLIGLILKEWT